MMAQPCSQVNLLVWFFENCMLNTKFKGSGDFTGSCAGLTTSPARMSTSLEDQGSGAYATCPNNAEIYDNTDPKYFMDHPDLYWILTNGLNSTTLPGAIPVGVYQNKNMFVGRVNISVNGEQYQQIGRVWNGAIYYIVPDGSLETSSDGNFEVLVCSKCPNGGSGDFCKLTFVFFGSK